MNRFVNICGLVILLMQGCLAADNNPVCLYKGCSDPSTAAAVNNRYFIIGDDEHNLLRMYSLEGSPDPVFSLDISSYLGVEPEHPEADIEASARIGNRIYWITSHGRNKDGKVRPSRYRFFAVDVQTPDPNQPPKITTAGKACGTLISDMLTCPQLNQLNIQDVTRLGEDLPKKQQAELAPKKRGLNIEALAAGPDGRSLWIGLRNPLYQDRSGKSLAIVIPLLNPDQVIDQGQKACFGDPLFLDLQGRGIRSMDYQDKTGRYWITAGAVDLGTDFKVFCYHPANKTLRTQKVEFPKDFTPEGVLFFPGRSDVYFISDDGTLPQKIQSPAECLDGKLLPDGSCPNKFLCDMDRRTFRIFRLETANP